MAPWHPRFTIKSERRAWVQVLRGVAYFAVGAAIVLGLIAGGNAVSDRWDRYREQRAERAHYASLGLRNVCADNVDAGCAKRASQRALVTVAWTPNSYSQLVVSVGPAKAAAVAKLANLPTKRMIGHYKAAEYFTLSFDKSSFHGDLYTAPTSRPGYAYRLRGVITVDGSRIRMWSAPWLLCMSETARQARDAGCAEDVWAEWHHDGQLYAADYTESGLSRSPTQTMQSLFRDITYTAPS